MKKIIAAVLALAMALMITAACAEESLFASLAGMEWSFTSGAGGWSTDMRIEADGSFSGEYHDSEMGETGEGYPDGTVYFCSFTGQLSVTGQADEYSWNVRVDRLTADRGTEEISDGIRFVPTDVYGLSEGDEMRLYSPGTPVGVFTDDMLLWAHVIDQETPPDELDCWFLCSEKNDSGFTGYMPLTLVNPWTDMTAEQLLDASGLSFAVPEGAENVIWRYMKEEGLAEMQFTWANGSFCARIQPVGLKTGEIVNIAGMYYDWMHEESVKVGGCPGTVAVAEDGNGWAELCLWHDPVHGLTYSLSVEAADVDGLDLAALAEQVYVPVK